jgi:hypothetical protein
MQHQSNVNLRLSAQRALLGAIGPEIRLVKVRDDGREIVLSVIAAAALEADAADRLSTAAAEIVSDFPDRVMREIVTIANGPLPREDVIACGWVYQRAE